MAKIGAKIILGALAVLGAAAAFADDVNQQVRFNGFMGVELEKQLDAQGLGDPKGSFDSDVIGIAINVHATDRVRVSLESDWEHGASTGANRGSLNLEYGFVEYTVSDALKVRAGKFLTPFGIFNEIHNVAYTFAPVKLPSPSNRTDRIVRDGYAPHPRWGTGVAVHGDVSLGARDGSYDVLIANGDNATVNPFDRDENSSKSVAARVRFEPTASLRIGASYYWDRTNQTGFTRLTSYGVEADLRIRDLQVLTEAIVASKRRSDGTDLRQAAAYLQAAYRLRFRLTPYVRLEVADMRGAPDDAGMNLITGMSYELDRNLFLKVENNHFRGRKQGLLGQFPGGGYDEIKVAACFGF